MTPQQEGDLTSSVFIILLFILVALIPFYSSRMAAIKKNWVKYRCDPRVMPFAGFFGHDTMQNFIQCAQQVQGGVMDEMLVPVNYNINQLTGSLGEMGEAVQDVREVVNQTRGFLGTITSSIFGVFLNITLQFEFMAIKTRDMVGKLAGLTAGLMYIMTGGVKVGESVASGPIVGMMKAVCFDPSTVVTLQNGNRIPMGDVRNGHILRGGSVVQGTLVLANVHEEALYTLNGVRVTGSHKVRNDALGRFVSVRNHPDSRKLERTLDEVVCLITSDHLIRLDNNTFWDWEDDELTAKTFD